MNEGGKVGAGVLPIKGGVDDFVEVNGDHSIVDRGAWGRRWRLRLGFILVPICHSAGSNIITLLAFRFLTDNLAFSAGAAGLLFGLVKIYDGITDPIIGSWTDRTNTRWGRRLPFILGGGILMPISIVGVFGMPDLGSVLIAQVLVTLALLLHATAYTALTIPSLAMAVEVSDDFDERTSLMAYRIFGNSIGTLVGATLPAFLLVFWGATRGGHLRMVLVIAAILLIVALVATWLLRDAPRTVPDSKRDGERGVTFFEQFRLAWRNHPFRTLAIAHIFVLFGVAITSASSAYFSKYVMGFSDAMLGSYFTVVTIGSIGSMPLWVRLSRGGRKKSGYVMAMSLYAIMHLLWFWVSPQEPSFLLAARALFTGIAAGGVILCAYSMMTDAIRYDYITSGLRREGAFAGFATLFDKLSAAAGIASMGLFLGSMGYVSSTTADAVQPPEALMAIMVCFSVVPSLAMLAAILIMSRYKLTEDMLSESAVGESSRG